MKSNKAEDWKKVVENEIKKREIKFVIFLISKDNNHLYESLKKPSLAEKGYISQFIKLEKYLSFVAIMVITPFSLFFQV